MCLTAWVNSLFRTTPATQGRNHWYRISLVTSAIQSFSVEVSIDTSINHQNCLLWMTQAWISTRTVFCSQTHKCNLSWFSSSYFIFHLYSLLYLLIISIKFQSWLFQHYYTFYTALYPAIWASPSSDLVNKSQFNEFLTLGIHPLTCLF